MYHFRYIHQGVHTTKRWASTRKTHSEDRMADPQEDRFVDSLVMRDLTSAEPDFTDDDLDFARRHPGVLRKLADPLEFKKRDSSSSSPSRWAWSSSPRRSNTPMPSPITRSPTIC